MPTWDFECPSCFKTETVSSPRCDPDAVQPTCECGRPMEIDYSNFKPGTAMFEPFESRNFSPGGELIRVQSKADLRRLENCYGVTHCPDPGLVAKGGRLVRRDGGWYGPS